MNSNILNYNIFCYFKKYLSLFFYKVAFSEKNNQNSNLKDSNLKMTLALFLLSITRVSAYHHHNSIERPLIQV